VPETVFAMIEDTHYKVYKLHEANPEISQRELTKVLGREIERLKIEQGRGRREHLMGEQIGTIDDC
jgi:hypothetical protein